MRHTETPEHMLDVARGIALDAVREQLTLLVMDQSDRYMSDPESWLPRLADAMHSVVADLSDQWGNPPESTFGTEAAPVLPTGGPVPTDPPGPDSWLKIQHPFPEVWNWTCDSPDHHGQQHVGLRMVSEAHARINADLHLAEHHGGADHG